MVEEASGNAWIFLAGMVILLILLLVAIQVINSLESGKDLVSAIISSFNDVVFPAGTKNFG